MKTIPLTRGLIATVDEELYDVLNQTKWCALRSGKKWYAYNARVGLMHHIVWGEKVRLDHINGDSLDNRRVNLRSATQAENVRNSAKRAGTTSRFKGVSRAGDKWVAMITHKGEARYLGRFEREIDAASAYNEEATRLFGSFARLNDTDATLPPPDVSDPDALLRQIAEDVQRGIASHGVPLSVNVLQRLVASAMPAAVDMTLRGYPMAAFEIAQNLTSLEMRKAGNSVLDGEA